MPETAVINLAKPITSVKILDSPHGSFPGETTTELQSQKGTSEDIEQVKLTQELKTHEAEVSQTCQIFKEIVDKLNKFHSEIFARHKEEIAKLAVEIARKILMQQVEQDNYEIEAIVKKALESTPTHQDLVVHLNPEDLVRFQKLQQNEPDKIGTLDGIKFIADSNIGRAECLIESSKGIIESLIDEHLKRIAEALKKAK